ncbi:MAG: HyaD/HybD family hydrogenase maturation endopeptidase [Desulfovermiculus sp.]
MKHPFQANVLILGVGNILLTDEGAGVRALQLLEDRYTFPPQVELLDGGTSGLELLPALDHRTHVYIIDVVQQKDLKPGQIMILDLTQSPGYFRQKISPHQLGLSEVLAVAEMSGSLPPAIILLGIQPQHLDTGLELSETVRNGLEDLIQFLVDDLSRLGLPPVFREQENES